MGAPNIRNHMLKMFSSEDVGEIFSAVAIRERARKVFDYVAAGKSNHFVIDGTQLETTAKYVVEVIKENYPSLEVGHHSRWRHFVVKDRNYAQEILSTIKDPNEKLRVAIEMVITSVLLDAGAGNDWQFEDKKSGEILNRSEGLAIASLAMFENGDFSSNENSPFRADASALENVTEDKINKAFQASNSNPLVGASGRANLLRQIGKIVVSNEEVFGEEKDARLGNLGDFLVNMSNNGKISLHEVLKVILYTFSGIWNGKYVAERYNLGDTWEHPALLKEEKFSGMMPFHKLSQWLTYSLIEPLEEFGLEVTEIELLTGLPEYRNGGLFVDMDVIKWKDRSFPGPSLTPSSTAIIEWRALTVVLLDMLAVEVRRLLRKTEKDFPLTKVLEGGSWAAGRKIAKKLRPEDSRPPIQIVSDATVF